MQNSLCGMSGRWPHSYFGGSGRSTEKTGGALGGTVGGVTTGQRHTDLRHRRERKTTGQRM